MVRVEWCILSLDVRIFFILQSPFRNVPINYNKSKNCITLEVLKKAIKSLNVNKALGPDKISNKFIKCLEDKVVVELLNIFNLCWSKGYYPKCWKVANSLLINKPGKPKSNPSNYQPIALICCIGKLLEKIIKDKLNKYLEKRVLINKQLAGFREKKGCSDKLFMLTETSTQAFNLRYHSSAVFMDVEKASPFHHV